jgi:lipopolysaccharide export system protein LptA
VKTSRHNRLSEPNGSKRPFHRRIRLWLIFGAAILLASVSAGADDKKSTPEAKPDEQKILITARQLVTNTATRLAEFKGEVRVRQGETVIDADSLKIHYTGGPQDPTSAGTEGESIEKIIAKGRVKIQMDNRIAFADHAVYTTADSILVLTGPNSRLTSGSNSITGSKITFYRADGRVIVEGSQDQRVEAVLFPGDKGLDIGLPEGR